VFVLKKRYFDNSCGNYWVSSVCVLTDRCSSKGYWRSVRTQTEDTEHQLPMSTKLVKESKK